MSLDLTLDMACEPKRSLGYGDTEIGTRVLLNLRKIELNAATIRQQATAEGRDLDKVRVRMEERDLTLPEMDAETAALAPLAPHCQSCPASGGGQPFGCIRIVNYPITRSAEEWILSRLPMPETIAGFLMLSALRDFQYDGEIVRRYRSEKLFEAPEGSVKPLPANEFGIAEVSTDTFFHAILGVGPKLAPWHLAMVLVWIDALRLDGFPPRTPVEFEKLTELPSAERPIRASVAIGEAHSDEGVRSMQRMLFAMASAWMYDLPLRVDS